MSAIHRSLPSRPALHSNCPFYCVDKSACDASFSSTRLEPTRIAHRCFSEDHEDCPLFLSKILRHSQPLFGRDPWPAHQK
ncbi:hypothetical protein [Geoalkalibacter subterraneus]|nr:hypothetical protein [Geoalkalibacter subterraneus]